MEVIKNEQGLYETQLGYMGDTLHLKFQKWGAEDATDTLLDIIAIAGESLGSLLALLTGQGADADVGSPTLDGLFRQLTLGLTRDRVLTKRVLKKLAGDRVQVNGVSIQYATFYKDQLPLVLAVARAQLEVQYGNFIAAAESLGLLGGKTQAVAPSSQP